MVGKAERLTWHKAWTMVSTGFSISYTSSSHEYDSVLSFQFICDNGKEINVNLTNWNINIFPGQELIIYFVENSKKTKKYHT